MQPQDAYGLEKLASEELAKHYDNDFGIECRVARSVEVVCLCLPCIMQLLFKQIDSKTCAADSTTSMDHMVHGRGVGKRLQLPFAAKF